MADDDGNVSNNPSSQRPQETFHIRAQETQAEHKFPIKHPGHFIIPRGSRGPKSLYLKRTADSFGFTLRHFIVYPPDSYSDDGRLSEVGELSKPIDTIFVRGVKELSPAHIAGLKCGDRLVGVNGLPINDKSYADVVKLIQRSPDYLHLLVVPKEDDILQRIYSETAHNPVSNQTPELSNAQHFLSSQLPREVHPDAVSWRSLENACLGVPNEVARVRARAQPQVARDMGRRASDGCALSNRNDNDAGELKMKAMAGNKNGAGCRLSFDSGRRGSSASSLSSSNSTLTGHEIDDSAILSRHRRSFQRKEEFLKMPPDGAQPREFYSRPKRQEKAVWPPESHKPRHHHFQRVKNDIDIEREQQMMVAKSPKERFLAPVVVTMKEAAVAPDFDLNPAMMVHTRARQFESGNPLPEDDPMSNRTSFYRSELARISSKRVVPNVTERAHEYETRASPQKKMAQRDAKSLDSAGSNNSGSSINEPLLSSPKKLSGNVIISSGSKYIHCPPPSENGKPTEGSEVVAYGMRARSNSTDSWLGALPTEMKKPERINRQDAITNNFGIKSKDYQQMMDEGHLYGDLPPLIPEPVEHMHFTPSVSITPAPATVLAVVDRPIRPNLLDLEAPIRPNRHLKPPSDVTTSSGEDERAMRRESYLRATAEGGGRMPLEVELSDGDISPQALRSAHRRWRPPLFPGDIQQLRKLFEDPTSSLLGDSNSSSSASLDREKAPSESDDKICKEGALHCKITEIDGKRFGDRSWKQIWALLKGPKLYLLKDKHHQSPMGTAADAVEHSLANGVDMRASCVRVAEDYTKRKNVLRVSGINPCRSEFLLQADNTEELAEWVKALQEKVATTTNDVEAKFDLFNGSKQQAVPQVAPLAPKSSKSRQRSPTGQSPVIKARKASSAQPDPTSPKSKTWRGRVVKQFRKMHGASSPSSPTAPEGSTFGIPLEDCLPSTANVYVPRIVQVCTDIIDNKGIQTVGIYRVPGNNASIMGLYEEVNKNFDAVPVDDARWNDLHVVSSLLKAYIRKIPDSLVTNALYPEFIGADKIEVAEERMKELKRLLRSLPPHNYHTLRHIILHLRRVSDNSAVNKMDLKNLAIVFGPNIVRAEENNMEMMVHNMNHQCKIVETFLSQAEWFFGDSDEEIEIPVTENLSDEVGTANGRAFLLDNLSKVEALKEGNKEKNGPLIASLISAAQRKVRRKAKNSESREEVRTPTSPYPLSNDLKDYTDSVIPTTVTDMEKHEKGAEKGSRFNYSTDQQEFYQRIRNFEKETNAMLQKPRQCEISVNNIAVKPGSLSSSASNVNANTSGGKPADFVKAHSASNVFSRTINIMDNNSRNSVQYNANSDINRSEFSDFSNKQQSDTNRNSLGYQMADKSAFDQRNIGRAIMRRGSSVENISTSNADLNANGTKKKIKFENEGEMIQRVGSLDSINKAVELDDEPDLVATMTKLYDIKLKEGKETNLLDGNDLPFVDESPEKHAPRDNNARTVKHRENMPETYRNPSLHKNNNNNNNNNFQQKWVKWEQMRFKESKQEMEKDEDSTETVPDRHISNKLTLTTNNNNKKNDSTAKLKRSESLTKAERNVSPHSIKLKRSESLNKADKLKRSDSLTKNEKTESNLNKRRELSILTNRRSNKDAVKLKRKNGMPDRSIKRRHTVGGTKDPDKVTWLDNKNQEEEDEEVQSNNKENKELRTSSPDLSSTRRERLLFEINLSGAENMVRALKQHLMGARPQSFPEASVFKVPLESHV